MHFFQVMIKPQYSICLLSLAIFKFVSQDTHADNIPVQTMAPVSRQHISPITTTVSTAPMAILDLNATLTVYILLKITYMFTYNVKK